MTVAADTPYVDHTSDAGFRVWGQAFKDLLTSVGLTNTSDTGQVNWASVTRAGTNTDAGYEIWRWNDTAHATRPMFFKVRYGTSNTTSRPRIQIDVGEGSNGSGTLTGAIKTSFFDWAHTNDNAGYDQIGMCYNTTVGFFGIKIGPGSSNNCRQIMVSFDRLKNTDGTPSTRGFSVVKPSDSDNNLSQHWTLTAGSWSSEPADGLPAFWPWKNDGGGSAAGLLVTGITPVTGFSTHGPTEKTIGHIAVGYGDFSGGNLLDVLRWDGVTYTYIVSANRSAANSHNMSSYTRTAMLWQ